MEGSSSVLIDSRTEGHGQVPAADKLLCNICDLEPLRNPVVTSCGHLYCWSCLNDRLQNQSQKRCQACASPLIHSANFITIYGDDSQVPLNEQSRLLCHICLESPTPTNAVTTGCGHVFCWPCLYQWLHRHRRDQGPCPVCKIDLKTDVNILPVLCGGNQEVYIGNAGVSSNMDTVVAAAEVANSGESIAIPPRPAPPEDALALSSRTHATSDDGLVGDQDELVVHVLVPFVCRSSIDVTISNQVMMKGEFH